MNKVADSHAKHARQATILVSCVYFFRETQLSVAKLEQMGGGAQLYHKYNDPCDVQTNSMTTSQFLTSKFNMQ
jgi:hypothetical protein